jgi:hypothetical protein
MLHALRKDGLQSASPCRLLLYHDHTVPAGVMAMPEVATKDGYDVQMQTNHLSHMCETADLLGNMRDGGAIFGQHVKVLSNTWDGRVCIDRDIC